MMWPVYSHGDGVSQRRASNRCLVSKPPKPPTPRFRGRPARRTGGAADGSLAGDAAPQRPGRCRCLSVLFLVGAFVFFLGGESSFVLFLFLYSFFFGGGAGGGRLLAAGRDLQDCLVVLSERVPRTGLAIVDPISTPSC